MGSPVLVIAFFLALMALILIATDKILREKIWLLTACLFQNFWKKAEIEKFFNEYSPAAKKLYAHCKRHNAAVGFVKTRKGKSIVGLIPVIALNEKIFKEKIKTNGMLEMIIAHELGHVIVSNETPYADFLCAKPKKLTFCQIADEIAAWEKAFLILNELNIKIDEDLFWREAALLLGTHFKVFMSICDKIKTPRCPKMIDFLSTKIITKFRNFNQDDYAEIEKIFFAVNGELDIPKKNFIIE